MASSKAVKNAKLKRKSRRKKKNKKRY